MTSSFPISIHSVGVFSLSNAAEASSLVRGAAALSRALGNVPVDTSFCVTEAGPRRLAGGDETRADRFNELLKSSSELLVSSRGGYGVTRVLDRVDFETLRCSGKALCGYSDVSALLLAAWKNGCTRLIHGPMVCSSWALEESLEATQAESRAFSALVFHGQWSLAGFGSPLRALKCGCVRGPVVPANLTLLAALLGTPFLPDLTGAILVLEDVHEPAHAIDRRLTQLRSAGILSRLGGLLFGHFTEAEDGEWLPEIFRECAEFVPGPVASGFPLGHDHPSLPLPVGLPGILEVPANGR